MSTYKPIPVGAAQDIAIQYDKSIVIIASFDPACGRLNVTTFGVSAQDKTWAADGGEIVAAVLGVKPGEVEFHENFRKHCCVKAGHVTTRVEEDGEVAVRCAAHPEKMEAMT